MTLVYLGSSGGAQNLRGIFQSPGDGRRKVAFSCSESDLKSFLRVLETGVAGEKALICLSRDRGFVEAISLGQGTVEIRYEIQDSRSRTGTKGVVVGQYKLKPVEEGKTSNP